jgi:hypothetical protein
MKIAAAHIPCSQSGAGYAAIGIAHSFFSIITFHPGGFSPSKLKKIFYCGIRSLKNEIVFPEAGNQPPDQGQPIEKH